MCACACALADILATKLNIIRFTILDISLLLPVNVIVYCGLEFALDSKAKYDNMSQLLSKSSPSEIYKQWSHKTVVGCNKEENPLPPFHPHPLQDMIDVSSCNMDCDNLS